MINQVLLAVLKEYIIWMNWYCFPLPQQMYQQEVEDLKVELSRAEFLEKVHLLIISKIVTDLNNHHLDQSPHFHRN